MQDIRVAAARHRFSQGEIGYVGIHIGVEQPCIGIYCAPFERRPRNHPKASPDKVRAALALVAAGVPVARAARDAGIGEGTLRRARQADARKGAAKGDVTRPSGDASAA